MIDEKGFFFCTREDMEKETGLSRGKQDRAIEKLEEFEIIKKISYGMPAKRYFKFLNKGIDNLEHFIKKEEMKEKYDSIC